MKIIVRCLSIVSLVLLAAFGSPASFAEIVPCLDLPYKPLSLSDVAEVPEGTKCKTKSNKVYERVVVTTAQVDHLRGWKGPDGVVWFDKPFSNQAYHAGVPDANGMVIGSPARFLCEDNGAELPTRNDVLNGEKSGFLEVLMANSYEKSTKTKRYNFWVANWGYNDVEEQGNGTYYYNSSVHGKERSGSFWVGHELACHHSNSGTTTCRYIGRPVKCVYRMNQ